MSAPEPVDLHLDSRKKQIADRRAKVELGRVPTAEDSLRVGLLIANAISAAVYGPRGEFRERQGKQKAE